MRSIFAWLFHGGSESEESEAKAATRIFRVKLAGVVELGLVLLVALFFITNSKVAASDTGLILNILGALLLGIYGFPIKGGARPTGSIALVGERENARALSFFGLTLFLVGFGLQLSFVS